MLHMIEANWVVFALALVIGLVVAWWIFARGSTVARPREHKPDVLDEGAAPARRNQALIDAPPAADLVPPPVSTAMAGIGEIVAVAAQDAVEEATARAAPLTPPAPPPVVTPPIAPPAVAPPAAITADDLTRIKGLGPKLVVLLQGLGVTGYGQIADWDEAEIDRIDAQLGAFAGRIRRDNWVEQARLLAAGDVAAYEAKFGKL
jgi:predicted flap endonuclease-1-like 5' DNA nuclease